MKKELYENLDYHDYLLPIIYHLDTLESQKQKTTFPMHWHDSVEILYFISGKAQAMCDLKYYTVSAGDVFIINKNQLHNVLLASEKCVYHCFILSDKLFPGINLDSVAFTNIIKSDALINRTLSSITDEINKKKAEYKTAAKGHLLLLISYLIRKYCHAKGENSGENKTLKLIKNSLSFMENNYEEKLTLDDICSQSNLSKYYFCRVFKQVMGKSPMQQLNILRTTKAMELLQSGDYNVTQAADICGFENYNYFSKVFKKYMHTLPREIKKNSK